MVIRRVRWWSYRIPFVQPFATAHGAHIHRDGIILQVETTDGQLGVGEAAPLPGFGGAGTVAARLLPSVARRLVGAPVHPTAVAQVLHSLFPSPTYCLPGAAAVRCGVDVAILDLLAQEAGKPLGELLPGFLDQDDAPPPGPPLAGGEATPHRPLASSPPRPSTPRVKAVPVNATVGAPEAGDAADLAAQAMAAGFETIKLKVGMAPDAKAEVERVAAVRAAIGPDAQLRLDANGAWLPDQAIAVIRACEPYDLQLVEQPAAAGDVRGLAHIRQNVRTPIAADESVTDGHAVCRLLAAGAVDVLVLKPMVIGSLDASLQLAALGRESGVVSLVTSTLETGVGIAAAAHLASALPGGVPACGLATAALLQSDLLEQSLVVEAGQLRLPSTPGIGIQVDWSLLARYTTGVNGIVESAA